MEFSRYLLEILRHLISVLALKILWSKRRKIWIIIVTFKRDMTFISNMLQIICFGWMKRLLTNETLPKSLDKLVQRKPNRTCFFYNNEKWTYSQVQSMSYLVANFFQAEGYRKGDVVGLAMQNRPEVICIWLGLSRIGVITALINFNLKGDSLQNCVKASKCKALIFGSEIKEPFQELWTKLKDKDDPELPQIFYELGRYIKSSKANEREKFMSTRAITTCSTSDFKVRNLETCLDYASTKPYKLRIGDEEPKFMDTCLYVFTSGTTGTPKAVKCSHFRIHLMGESKVVLKLCETDVAYCPLPLYHTFSFSALSWALVHGIPTVIVNKFSASKFWNDINVYKITVCVYMGELCRFILNQPPQPELERAHSLRKMFGCGIKPEIWESFVKRFKITQFVESYGSTEGNCSLVNMEGTRVGAIGYIPFILQGFYSLKVIKIDEVTGEILRHSKTGYAIVCDDNEPGELVAKIVNIFPTLRYDGYANNEANKTKIANDLFKKGDRYFRSGDIVVKDEFGYYYFKDRIGDTFRFKGENVSTAEVEGIITRLTSMKTTIVYGVEVPGMEGKAGMAAIADPNKTLDLANLAEGLNKELPKYARPIFVRLVKNQAFLPMTGTFKWQKFNLRKEGFDIGKIRDEIYIYDNARKAYKKLDRSTYKEIMQSNFRF